MKISPFLIKIMDVQEFIFEIQYSEDSKIQKESIIGWLNYFSDKNPSALSDDPSERNVIDLRSDLIIRINSVFYEVLRLPIFDKPEIRSEDAGDFRRYHLCIRAACANVFPIDKEVFVNIFKISISLIAWVENNHWSIQNNNTHVDSIVTRSIKILKQKISFLPQSTYLILQVAHRKNIPFRYLSAGIFQLGWGVNSIIIERSTTDLDSALGVRLSRNKCDTTLLLNDLGLPGAKNYLARSFEDAFNNALQMGYPVVVKPVDLERGEGVMVDVFENTLEMAFKNAKNVSPSKQVLIEKQVSGVCHRLFIARGQLLYAVKRLPIGVYGNGHHSLKKLIQTFNREQELLPSWRRSKALILDKIALEYLKSQNITIDSIPYRGQFIALRRMETGAWGGVDENVTQTIHPENIRAALTAVANFHLDIVGVDMISPDITQAWYENGAIINEINYAPLLGGGAISKSYLEKYIELIVPHEGRIPIVVYVGGAIAMQTAREYMVNKNNQGQDFVLTSSEFTSNSKGYEIRLSCSGLSKRVNALLMQKSTKALIIVVQTNEILFDPLQIDKIDYLHIVDEQVTDSTNQIVKKEQYLALLGILQKLRP